MEIRTAMTAILRQAAGRSSEVALVSFHGMSWQERLFIDWGEIKNAKSTLLDFYPDARGLMLDPYHAIGCMVVTKPGYHATQPTEQGERSFLFPKLSLYVDGGAAGKLTKTIHDVCESARIPGLHGKLTGHGIRAGAADDMLLTVHSLDVVGTVLGAIFRGGWEFVSECTMLRYLFEKKYIAMSEKILAGYEHSEQTVSQPTLAAIETASSNLIRIDNLALSIFSSPEWTSLAFQPLRDTILASLFMYQEQVVETYGKDHVAAAFFIAQCNDVGIEDHSIEQWGRQIHNKMQTINSLAYHAIMESKAKQCDGFEKVLVEQQKATHRELALLRDENRLLQKDLAEMKTMMAQLVLTQQQQITPVTSIEEAQQENNNDTDKEPQVSSNNPTMDPTPEPPRAPSSEMTNSFMELMRQPRSRSLGLRMSDGQLQEMTIAALLTKVRLHCINMMHSHPFGPDISRKVKAKAKKAVEEAISRGKQSGVPSLVAAATELSSKQFIDKQGPGYACQLKKSKIWPLRYH